MFPTLARLSKASRLPLTPKRGNKDYYKGKLTSAMLSFLLKDRLMAPGTRQAYLPGGHRTGAPGKHVVRGKAKYRLLDENVRFFVAPPVEEINGSMVRLTCHHLGVCSKRLYPYPLSFDHMSTSMLGSPAGKSEKSLVSFQEEA